MSIRRAVRLVIAAACVAASGGLFSCSGKPAAELWGERDLLPTAKAQSRERSFSTAPLNDEARALVQPAGTTLELYEDLPRHIRLEISVLRSPKTRSVIRIADETRGTVRTLSLKTEDVTKTFDLGRPGVYELAFAVEGPATGVTVWKKIRLWTPADPLSPETRPAPQPRAAGSRPDIYLYVIDALRPDHLGCYGYARETSPRIDDFARQSALFLEAYAQTSWTRASAASMLSGLPPKMHRTIGRDDKLPEDVVTIAERLKDHGYETAAVIANGHLHDVYGFRQGFETFEYVGGMASSDRVHARAEEILRRIFAGRGRKPLFFLIWTIDPHDPYKPAPEDAELFSPHDFEPIGNVEGNLLIKIHSGELRLTPSQKKYLETLYDQEIRGSDRTFGKFIDLLKSEGRYDEAVVVLTSDHGEELFDHGSVGHGRTLYNDQVRVPLIVKASSLTPRRYSGRVQHIDLVPTFLDLAGLDQPPELPGRSLLTPQAGPRTLFFELNLDANDMTAVLAEEKLIYYRMKPGIADFVPLFETYRGEDTAERRPENPDTFGNRRLRQLIFTYRNSDDSPYRPARLDVKALPREVREQLEALGYLK